MSNSWINKDNQEIVESEPISPESLLSLFPQYQHLFEPIVMAYKKELVKCRAKKSDLEYMRAIDLAKSQAERPILEHLFKEGFIYKLQLQDPWLTRHNNKVTFKDYYCSLNEARLTQFTPTSNHFEKHLLTTGFVGLRNPEAPWTRQLVTGQIRDI